MPRHCLYAILQAGAKAFLPMVSILSQRFVVFLTHRLRRRCSLWIAVPSPDSDISGGQSLAWKEPVAARGVGGFDRAGRPSTLQVGSGQPSPPRFLSCVSPAQTDRHETAGQDAHRWPGSLFAPHDCGHLVRYSPASANRYALEADTSAPFSLISRWNHIPCSGSYLARSGYTFWDSK